MARTRPSEWISSHGVSITVTIVVRVVDVLRGSSVITP